MNTWSRRALFAAGFSLTVTSAAFAALSDVDPGPYTFATGGYPMWYKDSLNQSLELCQSRATSTRAQAHQGRRPTCAPCCPSPVSMTTPCRWYSRITGHQRCSGSWPKPQYHKWATAVMSWRSTLRV